MRIVGPQPCYTRVNGGAVVSNVSITSTGTGGFAALDISCQSHASVSGVKVNGGVIAIYRDSNLTLTGEQCTPGPSAKRCAPPWAITSDALGPSQNITISRVASASGSGTVRGNVLGLSITTQTIGQNC